MPRFLNTLIVAVLSIALFAALNPAQAQFGNLKDKLKKKAEEKIGKKIDDADSKKEAPKKKEADQKGDEEKATQRVLTGCTRGAECDVSGLAGSCGGLSAPGTGRRTVRTGQRRSQVLSGSEIFQVGLADRNSLTDADERRLVDQTGIEPVTS